ncbi:MAG TPA: cupin domain-containing protein [Puia sp.]|nr:cupin domain-containing protein [Puia sp.]
MELNEQGKLYRKRTNIPLADGGTHYKWGDDCDGWVLVDEKSLSVKVERMWPNTSEQKHYHEKAKQFFFILKGIAVFEVQQERISVKAGDGIYIEAGKEHRILNEEDEYLEFTVTSQPSTNGDRINIE